MTTVRIDEMETAGAVQNNDLMLFFRPGQDEEIVKTVSSVRGLLNTDVTDFSTYWIYQNAATKPTKPRDATSGTATFSAPTGWSVTPAEPTGSDKPWSVLAFVGSDPYPRKYSAVLEGVRGLKGDKGDQGEPGDPGDDGASGGKWYVGDTFVLTGSDNDFTLFTADVSGTSNGNIGRFDVYDEDGNAITAVLRGDIFEQRATSAEQHRVGNLSGPRGSTITVDDAFPASPGNMDMHVFPNDVASGLVWKDTDGTTDLTAASAGDFAQYNGTNWVKQGNLEGPQGNRGQRGYNVTSTRTTSFFTGNGRSGDSAIAQRRMGPYTGGTVRDSTGTNILTYIEAGDYAAWSGSYWAVQFNMIGATGSQGPRGAALSSGDAFPTTSIQNGDFHLFPNAVASGLTWIDTDGSSALTAADAGDFAQYDSGNTRWVKQGRLTGLAGPQGDPGDPGSRGSLWNTGGSFPASPNDDDFHVFTVAASSLTGYTTSGGSSLTTAVIGDYAQYDGTNWIFQGNIRGPEGPQGNDGNDGSDGTNGADGTDGTNGTDGERGSLWTSVTTQAGFPTASVNVGDHVFVNADITYDNTATTLYTGTSEIGNNVVIEAGTVFEYRVVTGSTTGWLQGINVHGEDGRDGTDGTNGSDGTDGTEGKRGSIWTTASTQGRFPVSGIFSGDHVLTTGDITYDAAHSTVTLYRGSSEITDSTVIDAGTIYEYAEVSAGTDGWIERINIVGMDGSSASRGRTWYHAATQGDFSLNGLLVGDFTLTTGRITYDAGHATVNLFDAPGREIVDDVIIEPGTIFIYTVVGNGSNGWKQNINIQGMDGGTGGRGADGADGVVWTVGTSFPVSANDGDLHLFDEAVASGLSSYVDSNDMSITSAALGDFARFNGTDTKWQYEGTLLGAQGPRGIQGDAGDDGSTLSTGLTFPGSPSISDIHFFNGNASGLTNYRNSGDTADVTIARAGDYAQYFGTSWFYSGSLIGPQGPQGDPGTRGTAWNVGSTFRADPIHGDIHVFNSAQTAITGYQNSDSSARTTAVAGDYAFYNTNIWEFVDNIEGPTGPQGGGGTRGTQWTVNTAFPGSPIVGDIHLFDEPVLSGLVWKNVDGSSDLTAAATGDYARWDGTNWVKQGEIGGPEWFVSSAHTNGELNPTLFSEGAFLYLDADLPVVSAINEFFVPEVARTALYSTTVVLPAGAIFERITVQSSDGSTFTGPRWFPLIEFGTRHWVTGDTQADVTEPPGPDVLLLITSDITYDGATQGRVRLYNESTGVELADDTVLRAGTLFKSVGTTPSSVGGIWRRTFRWGLTAVNTYGSGWTTGTAFPEARKIGDLHLFTADASSLTNYKDSSDTALTSASAGDYAKFDGTDWIEQGSVVGPRGQRGITGNDGGRGARGTLWSSIGVQNDIPISPLDGDYLIVTAPFSYDRTRPISHRLYATDGTHESTGRTIPAGSVYRYENSNSPGSNSTVWQFQIGLQGVTGVRGSQWTSGTAFPGSPVDGDFHLFNAAVASGLANYETSTGVARTSAVEGDYAEYESTGTKWIHRGRLSGASSSWTVGTAFPTSQVPVDGDFHLFTGPATGLTNYRDSGDTVDVTIAVAGDYAQYDGTSWFQRGSLQGTPSELTPGVVTGYWYNQSHDLTFTAITSTESDITEKTVNLLTTTMPGGISAYTELVSDFDGFMHFEAGGTNNFDFTLDITFEFLGGSEVIVRHMIGERVQGSAEYDAHLNFFNTRMSFPLGPYTDSLGNTLTITETMLSSPVDVTIDFKVERSNSGTFDLEILEAENCYVTFWQIAGQPGVGTIWTSGDAFPTNPTDGAMHLFPNAVTGLAWKDTDGTADLTTASVGEYGRYDQGNSLWVKQGSLNGASGTRGAVWTAVNSQAEFAGLTPVVGDMFIVRSGFDYDDSASGTLYSNAAGTTEYADSVHIYKGWVFEYITGDKWVFRLNIDGNSVFNARTQAGVPRFMQVNDLLVMTATVSYDRSSAGGKLYQLSTSEFATSTDVLRGALFEAQFEPISGEIRWVSDGSLGGSRGARGTRWTTATVQADFDSLTGVVNGDFVLIETDITYDDGGTTTLYSDSAGTTEYADDAVIENGSIFERVSGNWAYQSKLVAAGLNVSLDNEFPASTAVNDVHIFDADIDEDLVDYRHEGASADSEVASQGDVAKYDGTRWNRIGNLRDLVLSGTPQVVLPSRWVDSVDGYVSPTNMYSYGPSAWEAWGQDSLFGNVEWVDGSNYAVNSIRMYNGRYYSALRTHTASSTNAPSGGTDSATHWLPLQGWAGADSGHEAAHRSNYILAGNFSETDTALYRRIYDYHNKFSTDCVMQVGIKKDNFTGNPLNFVVFMGTSGLIVPFGDTTTGTYGAWGRGVVFSLEAVYNTASQLSIMYRAEPFSGRSAYQQIFPESGYSHNSHNSVNLGVLGFDGIDHDDTEVVLTFERKGPITIVYMGDPAVRVATIKMLPDSEYYPYGYTDSGELRHPVDPDNLNDHRRYFGVWAGTGGSTSLTRLILSQGTIGTIL